MFKKPKIASDPNNDDTTESKNFKTIPVIQNQKHTNDPKARKIYNNNNNKKLNKKLLKMFTPKPDPSSQQGSFRKETDSKNMTKKSLNDWWTQVSAKNVECDIRSLTTETPIQKFSLLSSDSNKQRSSRNELDLKLNHSISSLKTKIDALKTEVQNDQEIFFSDEIEVIFENFKYIDSNKKSELTSNLYDFSKTSPGRKHLKLIRLIEILHSDYSSKNLDLFENYRFNNTAGEMSTEILLNILNVLYQLTNPENRTNLKDALESEILNELLIQLLYSYIVDLEKNKNNVKRIKKIEGIKCCSIRVLNNILGYLKFEFERDETEQSVLKANGLKLVQGVLDREKIEVDYDPKREEKKILIGRLSMENMQCVDKRDTFMSYLRLVENLLGFYLNRLMVMKIEIKEKSFLGFLTSEEFFEKLNNHFRLRNSEFNEIIESIFQTLVSIKNNSNLSQSEEKCSDMSIDVEKSCLDEHGSISELLDI